VSSNSEYGNHSRLRCNAVYFGDELSGVRTENVAANTVVAREFNAFCYMGRIRHILNYSAHKK
jgi:hypothetical protein